MGDKIEVTVDVDLEPLIPGFLDNRRQDVVTLNELLDSSDWPKVQSIGHNLKGVGGGYGFMRITEIGAAIEVAAKQTDTEAARRQVIALQDYLERIQVTYA
ncbi:MAG: Hpt domain-containing protein [Gammaproteobacteria bacterium]